MKKTVFALLAFTSASAVFSAAAENQALLVRDSIIDPRAHYFPSITFGVPTVHGVTFQQEGILTHKGWQYAAYYNAVGHVSLGRRRLPDGEWETFSLTDYTFTEVNSHNSVVLGISARDGTIHLSFDHHNDPLKYRVSVSGVVDAPETIAWGPGLFGPIRGELVGPAIVGITYPRFISAPCGKLLFTYRTGGAGAGDDILYEYDGATGAWTRIGMFIIRAGSYSGRFTPSGNDRNAYLDNVVFDRNGRLHITWCWRETPDPRSNHGLMYAFSDDNGRTWKNQLGATVGVTGVTPMRVDTPGLLVWDIPQNRNYINNSGMTVDAQGRVHVMAWHFPDNVPDQTSGFDDRITAPSRFHHYWRGLDGIWRRNPTNLTGSRPKLVADDDGRLFMFYGDAVNLQIAVATPEANWADWQVMNLTGRLPAGRGPEVNAIHDPVRWEEDRILSIYVQQRTNAGGPPTPLHALDYHISRSAVLPLPVNNAKDVATNVSLTWIPGRGAVAHDVFFGAGREAVRSATSQSSEYRGRTTSTVHAVAGLDQETRYYWRIDAVDAAGRVTPGRVWSFDTVNYRPVAPATHGSRGYGGTGAFAGILHSASGAPARVTLYWGVADRGMDAAGWEHSLDLGELSVGPLSVEKAGLGEEDIYFRFLAANQYGAQWSPAAGVTPAGEDLAHWNRSAEIVIDFGEELQPLADFPVLVRLGPDQLAGFSYADFLSPPFSDLRFSDASGSVSLPFEMARWNPSGVSYVWVRAPEVRGRTAIRVWWGREGRAAPSRSEQARVWSADFGGVWHLDHGLGVGLDSSPHATPSSTTGVVSPATMAVVSGAASFDGNASAVRIVNAPALNPNQITVEAWIRTTQSGIASIISKDRTATPQGRVWQFRINNERRLEFIVFNSSANHSLVSTREVANGQWRHVAGTWDGQVVRLYIDGELNAESAFSGSPRTGQGNDVFIGRMETTNPAHFLGDIDEVRVSRTARSADWIRASWLNQRPGSAIARLGSAGAPDLDDDLLSDSWEMAHFGTFGIANGRGGSDTGGNGVPDLIAYAMGVDPLASDGFPFVKMETTDSGLAPMVTFDQRAGGSGAVGTDYSAARLRYVAEFSRDLVNWLSGPQHVEFTGARRSLPGGMERVTVRFRDNTGEEASSLFARVRIVPVN